MSVLPSATIDQIIQGLTKIIWERPEFSSIREPLEQALSTGAFKKITVNAFDALAERSHEQLPKFFDTGFITMPRVQEKLSAYIINGDRFHLGELANLYSERFLKPADAPNIEKLLDTYLTELRETFAVHPTYGPILLARDIQSINSGLNRIEHELHERFNDLTNRFNTASNNKNSFCPQPPRPPDHFGGRDEIYELLKARLKAGQTTVITAIQGLGGIGKTTLARQLAYELYLDRTFNAVLWTPVTRSPDIFSLLTEWGRYGDLSYTPDQKLTVNQVAQQVRVLLDHAIKTSCQQCDTMRLLIVLDDVWDSGLEAARLLIREACPDYSTILITTRSENLARNLQIVSQPLARMSGDEAAKLLQTYLPNAGLKLLELLGNALGGHPLAMELAARRILKELGRPGETLETVLKNAIAQYEMGIPSNTPFAELKLEHGETREDNLTIALAYSYEDLKLDDQLRFRTLGILPHDQPFDTKLLAALWDMQINQVEGHLDTLRLLALIEPDSTNDRGWYRQHPLLRSYAYTLLDNVTEFDSVLARYSDYIIGAIDIVADTPEKMAYQRALLPHIIIVGEELEFNYARNSLSKEFNNRVLNFVLKVKWHRGIPVEWLLVGLKSCKFLNLPYHQILLMHEIGKNYASQMQHQDAVNYYKQVLELDRLVGNPENLDVLNDMAKSYLFLHKPLKAKKIFEKILKTGESTKSDFWAAVGLTGLGNVNEKLNQFDEALLKLQQAYEKLDRDWDKVGVLHNISAIYFKQGETHRAAQLLYSVAEGYRRVDLLDYWAGTNYDIAVTEKDQGQVAKAIKLIEEAIYVLEANGFKFDPAGRNIEDYQRFLLELRSLPPNFAPKHKMLEPKTIEILVQKTIACCTYAKHEVKVWRKTVDRLRTDALNKGIDWLPELTFSEVLLAILDARPALLPTNHPYHPYYQQVVEAVEKYQK